jgi:hypothetical protein
MKAFKCTVLAYLPPVTRDETFAKPLLTRSYELFDPDRVGTRMGAPKGP